MKVAGVNLTYEGLVPRIKKSFLSKDVDALQPHVRAFVERAVTFTTCPDCKGTRLNESARSSKIGKTNIADACAMQISDLAKWVGGLKEPSVAPLLAKLGHTLDSFVEIGLGYLSLDRPSGTLSGGEAQRTKLVSQLGSSLTDVTYVFDEPTIGMHPHDIQRMNALLLRLRDKGNTVLVVEHKPETIAIADVVDRSRSRRGHRRRGGRVPGDGRSVAREQHAHRPAPQRQGVAQADRAQADRRDEGEGREDAQPQERQRGHPARRARGRHRRGRVGQELAHSRIGLRPRRRGDGRSGRNPRIAAEQSGDVHRPARSHPHRVRQGQQRQARALQRELRGRVSDLQWRRRDLHRPRHDGRRQHRVRGLRGQAIPGVGARVQVPSTSLRAGGRTSPRCSTCR